MLSRLSVLAGRAGLAIMLASVAVPKLTYTVPPGHRAVVFDRFVGVKPTVYDEGIHFKIPWVHTPHIMDVRTTPTNIPTITGARDLQQVTLSVRILSRPHIEQLPHIFNTIGLNYNEAILPSVCNEVLKAVVAQYNAEQLITQRDLISREVRENLVSRCDKFNILLDDVSITHVTFSPDFAKAIEEKQVAEQIAERAKFIVSRAEQEQIALITRSEGEAEAARLVADALEKSGPGLLELRKIDTAVAVAEQLSKKTGVTYLPGSSNNMIMIDPEKFRKH